MSEAQATWLRAQGVPPPTSTLRAQLREALLAAKGEPGRLRVRLEAWGLKAELEPAISLRTDTRGLWITARLGEHLLRRRADGGVHFAAGPFKGLDDPPASPWHLEVAWIAKVLRERLGRASAEPDPVPGAEARARAAGYLRQAEQARPRDFVALEACFRRTYPEAVPILPPDRYRDLVVLPAVGCPHAACSFCAWYQEARFAVLDPAALSAHLDGIEALFGQGATSRDGLFLGSASAFSVGDAKLGHLLALCGRRFGHFDRGVAGFLEPDHAPNRSAPEWAALGEAGVRRVVLGLETGHGPLRARLGKPAGLERFVEQAGAIREAGIGLGLTVLLGIAGEGGHGAALREAHLEQTAQVLEGLALGPEDLVYLSPWDRAPEAQVELEREEMRSAIKGVSATGLTDYRLERYRYFA